MSGVKKVPSPVSRSSGIRQNLQASPLKKTRGARGDGGILKIRRKDPPKLVCWLIELLLAVGFDVAKRFVKSWTRSLAKGSKSIRDNTPEPSISSKMSSGIVSAPHPGEQQKGPWIQRPRPFATRVLNLFIDAAKEWSRDKCPQLGAALAYYTVFSLAPLVIVLLGVFGLIYGGSEPARAKILEQLGYYIDPSGVKVFQEIASHAAQPKAGILASVIGIVIALVGASGIFGQLQEALNTIWSVKAKPNQGIRGFIRA